MASSGAGSTTRNCVGCGRSIDWNANVCPHCGHDYRMQMRGQIGKGETAMPTIGGVLILVAGLIELAWAAVLIAGGTFFIPFDWGGAVLAVCGIALALVAVVALLGGVYAIRKRHFNLAILGGILGLPGWIIPGMIGLILVAMSRDEFRD